MRKRKLWIGLDSLFEKILRGHVVIIAQLSESKSVEARRFRIGRQRSEHCSLVGLRNTGHAEPVPEFDPDPRNQLKEVLAAADLRDLRANLSGSGILQAHIKPQLSALRSAYAGVRAQNQDITIQSRTDARGCL